MISEFMPVAGVGGPAAALAAYQVARSYGVAMPYWKTGDKDTRRNVRRAALIKKKWARTMRHHKLMLVDDVPTFGEQWGGGHTQKSPRPRILVPDLCDVYADPYGVILRVRVLARVGADEFRKAAKSLGDVWKVRDVQIQDLVDDDPGFIQVTVLVNDPMTITEDMQMPDRLGAELPEDRKHEALYRLPLGRGQNGETIWLTLKENNSTTVFGASGFGKTNALQGWVCRLAPSPEVQIVGANGKAESDKDGDFRGLAPRFSYLTGGTPQQANLLLRGLKAEMMRRLQGMYKWYGKDQFWKIGPRPELPLIVAVMDECQEYLTSGLKPTSEENKALLAIIAENVTLAKSLQRMGRAAGLWLIWATQKGTGDAIPTDIRDVAPYAISFATRGRAMEVAALGEEMADYPDMSTRKLLKDKYKGVGTIKADGVGGMVRFKAPYLDIKMAEALCLSTAKYVRRIPGLEEVGCYDQVPDSPAELFDPPKPSGHRPRGGARSPRRGGRAGGNTNRRTRGGTDN